MNVDRERFLLLAAALGACHDPSPAATPAVVSLPTPAPTPTPAVHAAGFCEKIFQDNQEVLEHPTSVDCPDDPDGGVQAALLESSQEGLFHYCKESRSGAWAVRALSSQLTSPIGEGGVRVCSAELTYQLVYAKSAAEAISTERRWSRGEAEATVGTEFDYDGDGNDEIIVSNTGGRYDDPSLEVLRAVGSVVEPYPTGFHFDGWVDADGDGRPDLTDGSFFMSVEPCGGFTGSITIRGVPLLLHSRSDGTFSMNDEVARRWAKTQCPTLPRPRTDVDAPSASCEYLWGRSAKQITSRLSKVPTCGGESDADIVAELLKKPLPVRPLNVNTPEALPTKRD